MVERLNDRISEPCRQTRFRSAAELRETPKEFSLAYNRFIPQPTIGHRSPINALASWYDRHPNLFIAPVYNHAECDSPSVS
ncbi:MAG: hypothetical protein LBD68_07590 [Zoogloeaceae bacterium]|jgi:hypothetical protein|nr:hypothetical protein [Zoogloeaceae bacterium]